MKKLAIVHFSPIEKYPPVMNWLDFLIERAAGAWEIRVFTTLQDGFVEKPYRPTKDFIRIRRFAMLGKKKPFSRWLAYFSYYSRTLLALIRWRPDAVLYYETLSAWPALAYKKLGRPGAGLFVHYHEYTSPDEYILGMTLNRWFHRWEKKMYPAFSWISHTNADRLKLFMGENLNINPAQTHILPNYPPLSWKRRRQKEEGGPIKFVYVGALSLDTIYTAEFAEWVEKQHGKVSWDIFSSNCTPEALKYLESLDSKHIRFRGGVEYASLPGLLQEYDVGLVLYKGTIPNYVYNISNKLFEYFACDLDVWFAKEMKTSLELVTCGVYPKITAIDLADLDRLPLQSILDRSGLVYSPSPFYCEQVFMPLLDKLEQQL
jgi:hypothetical protein